MNRDQLELASRLFYLPIQLHGKVDLVVKAECNVALVEICFYECIIVLNSGPLAKGRWVVG
jgi:hypothetical protein